MKANTFFRSTKTAWESITDCFSFIWPAAAGLWNLRWQLIGYKSVNPNVTNDELTEKFAKGMGLIGFNFKPLVDKPWDVQLDKYALFLLVNIFAVYEGWIADVLIESSISFKDSDDCMQFPVPHKNNVSKIFQAVQASKSGVIAKSYYPVLIRHKKYNKAKIGNLLLTYRLFKEIRNAYIHNGGMVDQKVLNAQINFNASVTTNADQGTEIMITAPQQVLGKNIKLTIQQVVGFSEVILMLMITFDAELSVHKPCEQYLAAKYLPFADRQSMPHDPSKKYSRICGIIKRFHAVRPLPCSELIDFFEIHKLVRRQ